MKCPICNHEDKDTYVGFTTIECMNNKCIKYKPCTDVELEELAKMLSETYLDPNIPITTPHAISMFGDCQVIKEDFSEDALKAAREYNACKSLDTYLHAYGPILDCWQKKSNNVQTNGYSDYSHMLDKINADYAEIETKLLASMMAISEDNLTFQQLYGPAFMKTTANTAHQAEILEQSFGSMFHYGE